MKRATSEKDLTISGEHSSELRPDTLLASDGSADLRQSIVMLIITRVIVVLN